MGTYSSLQAGASKQFRLPLNKDFRSWTFDDVTGFIESAIMDGPTREGYDQNFKYVVLRDHWQKGDPWVGPRGTPETEQLVLDGVEPQFTPVDTTTECLGTFTNALLERRPSPNFVARQPVEEGSDEEQAQKDRAAKVVQTLLQWAQKRKLWQLSREVTKRSRWATWATWRAWVPEARLDRSEYLPEGAEEGAEPSISYSWPTFDTLEEALDAIHVSIPDPECCVVYEDCETRERAALFSYWYADKQCVEIWWVDRVTLQTYVRTLRQGSPDPTEVVMDLGGRLPIVQLDGELMVTEAVRRQQARLNFFESLMVRVGETAGFPERYTLNAKPTGIWLETAPSDGPSLETIVQDGVTWYLHPSPRSLGALITTDLVGVQDQDPVSGQFRTTTPGVEFRDPTDPEFAIKSADHAKQSIREECKQGHIGMNGEATTTGWSRVQARAAFVTDVKNHQGPLQLSLEQLLESVLALAGLMTEDESDFLDTFRASVTVHVSPGPVAPEDRTSILAQVEQGLLSMESALLMLGQEDVEAELQRIRGQPEAQLSRLEKLFTVMGLGTAQGLSLVAVAQLAKLPDDEMEIITADVALTNDANTEDEELGDTGEGDGVARPRNPGKPAEGPPARAPAPAGGGRFFGMSGAPPTSFDPITQQQDQPEAEPVDLGPVLQAIAALQQTVAQLASAPPAQPEINITLPAINLTLTMPNGSSRTIQVTKQADGSFTGSVTPVEDDEARDES